MPDFEFSKRAQEMLAERKIPDEWVWRTINSPDRTEMGAGGNAHYIKTIPEHGGRFFRVVINESVSPKRIVTLFFDRRLRRKT